MAKVVINENKCKSCYLCIDVCPKKIIKKSDKIGVTGRYVVTTEDTSGECIGCGFCAMRCPDLAITEVYR